MVQAFVRLKDDTNQVLNIVKAKHGLKDKSEAINKVVSDYKMLVLEPLTREEDEIMKELLRIRRAAKKNSYSERTKLKREIEKIRREKGEKAVQEYLYKKVGLH